MTPALVRGPLPGNGTDQSAQRNGLVIATNIILGLKQEGLVAAEEQVRRERERTSEPQSSAQ